MCDLPHEPDAPPGPSGNAQGDGGRDVRSSEPLRWAVMLAASFAISAAIVAAYAFWLAPRPQHFARTLPDIIHPPRNIFNAGLNPLDDFAPGEDGPQQ